MKRWQAVTMQEQRKGARDAARSVAVAVTTSRRKSWFRLTSI
jgi:hypothetical protein